MPLLAPLSTFFGLLPPIPEETTFEFRGDVQNVMSGMIPRIYNRSYSITADLVVPEGGAEGVIVAEADHLGGFTLYVKDGKLTHTYSMMGVFVFKQVAEEDLPTGDVTVRMEFAADGATPATGGEVTLFIDDRPVGKGRMDHTVPIRFSGYAGMDIGRDNGGVVDLAYEDQKPFAFTGTVKKVTFDIKPHLSEQDELDLHAAEQPRGRSARPVRVDEARRGHGGSQTPRPEMTGRVRALFSHVREDAIAGAVLGVESVPDGLATGLLAAVNPLAGVYGYMVGTVGGALSTSSTFMAVQGTGAMAIIVADVTAVHDVDDPARALVTLSVLTGVVMVVAGLLRFGGVLRFVSNAVLVGFINAVGVNIVLGQLPNLTGYNSDKGTRVTRVLDTVLHPGRLDGQSVVIGVGTIVLILVLERTPLGSLGLVVAVVATSALANLLSWHVATVQDLGVSLGSLPSPVLPDLGLVPELVVPALSLALVGLVQGAGISANFPNEGGAYPTPLAISSAKASPTLRQAFSRACPWAVPCLAPR